MKLDSPPVVELVLGFHLKNDVLSQQHIFNIYEKLKEDFPTIEERQPLLDNPIRRPGETVISVGQSYNSRKLFINSEDNKLVQLQSNKFFFNWRKGKNQSDYPDFAGIMSDFNQTLARIEEVVEISSHVDTYETTYFDHIVQSEFQTDSFNPFPALNLIKMDRDLTGLNLELFFHEEAVPGDILLRVQSAIRNSDSEKILNMETKCLGKDSKLDYKGWFDRSHEELVNLFGSLLQPKALEVWKQRS